MINKACATAALVITAILVTTSCGGSDSSGSSSPAPGHTGTGEPSSSSAPSTFTSDTYGYTVVLPADWTSFPAAIRWDGIGALNRDAFTADQFRSASDALGFAAAAPWKGGLAAYTKRRIVLNYRFHGDTCPRKPDARDPVTVGGQPGVLVSYNCGILVDWAATVHNGVGYLFSFVDPDVYGATDPTDHATFLAMLSSVQFHD